MAVTIWVLDVFFFFPSYIFSIIELKLACFYIHLFTKHLRITLFGKIQVVTETWLDKKDVHTVGQLPLADKLWFTIWSRLHLIQEKSTYLFVNQKFKAIVNCNHNTIDVLKNCHAGNQRRDVAWQLSRN